MEYKWVRKDMDLIKIINPNYVITIQNSGVLNEDFYKYSNCFNEAGNLIMQHLLTEASQQRNIAKLDLWYFALVYLYRQSIELLLKSNIFKIEKEETKYKDILGNIGHDVKLAFDNLINRLNININDNENLLWLEAFLEDISKIDSDSDMFRYPFGNRYNVLFTKQTHVNLPTLYYNMNRAFNMLKEFYLTNNFSNKKVDEEYSYPPKLIIEGGEYYGQSVVGYKYNERAYYPYNTSYQECASFLRDQIVNNKNTKLFLPMCYLYRNALELGLKKLIVEGSGYDNNKIKKILNKKRHSVVGLWNSIVGELKGLVPDEDCVTLDIVSTYINAFHNYDTSSTKFRYPCDKEVNLFFKDEQQLDIINFSDCFEELLNFLDGADGLLLQYREFAAEMEAEYHL